MFKKQEPVITMTADELAALVDARIAERDARALREAEESKKPKTEPRAPELPARYQTHSAEFDAFLLRNYDATANQGLHEDARLAQMIETLYRQYTSTAPSKPTIQHLDSWRGCPWTELDWMERAQEHGRLVSLIRLLLRNRQNPAWREEEQAQRMKLEEGIGKNARYWDEARPLSDFSDEELKAEMAKRAHQVVV